VATHPDTKEKHMNRLIIIFPIAFLTACSAKQVSPGAEKIFVSENPPPQGCLYMGEVQGSQGNFWTSEFTSDRNLLTGARNEMRNQALSLGANYVVVETQSHSHNTAGYSLGGTYASVIIGNAYKCPAQFLGQS
jgi:hypothetical protein